MLPFVDIHIHLLAGLDDGPKTMEDSLEMCRIACAEGTGSVAALAHQGEGWPDNSPERIRAAAAALQTALKEAGIPLATHPSAEVMLHLDLEEGLDGNRFLTLADRGKYLLVEFPPNVALDFRPMAEQLLDRGLTPVIAHIERYPDLFMRADAVEDLVRGGCVVQVNAASIVSPYDRPFERTLKDMLRRNLVHVVASDGHNTGRRPPLMRAAFDKVAKWAGPGTADRLFSIGGNAILNGLPLRVPPVLPPAKKSFFGRLFAD